MNFTKNNIRLTKTFQAKIKMLLSSSHTVHAGLTAPRGHKHFTSEFSLGFCSTS
jgi:hypothetical protein